MLSLIRYLKDYKKEAILAPLFKLLEASFELIVPLVMAAMIDRGIHTADKGFVLQMGGILLLLAVIGLVCSVTAQYYAAKAATGFATKLRHALFSHMESLSFSEMDQLGTSTMITRMTSDINQVQSGVNMILRLFLRSPFIVVGAMVMAFTIDVKAALIFVVLVPVLSVVIFGIMMLSIPLYRKVQAALDRVLGLTRENLTGVRVIRAFHKEDAEKEHFQETNLGLTRLQMTVGRLSALMNPITYVCVNLAIAALLWCGAIRVNSGILTQGQVVALVNYMSQILVELIKLANLIITVTKAFACADRIRDVFAVQSSMPVPQPAAAAPLQKDERVMSASSADTPAVAFEQVGFTYQGSSEETLTDLDFTVQKGQTIGIIGGTGSGKSSLVALIPRFYDCTRGRVLLNGTDVRKLELNQLRSRIGIVMQQAVLFEGTVRENLLWGKENATDAELWDAIRLAQAEPFLQEKEGGLDYRIEQGGRNLSGGQKQRLTIARALVRKPEILILDDSASALDFATDARLRKAIRAMEGKMTVFLVSQRAASLLYADRILVMDDGRIADSGTHEELLAGSGIYQEIYYSQFPREEGAADR